MKNLMSPQNVVYELLKRIPAFAFIRARDDSYMSHDNDRPYLVFGDFGIFLSDLSKQRSVTPETANILEESFSLLSEMVTSPDDEVANIAVVCVLEILTDSPEGITLARRYFSGKALDIFQRVVDGWIPNNKL